MRFSWAVLLGVMACLSVAAAVRVSPVAVSATPAGVVVLGADGQLALATWNSNGNFQPIGRIYTVVLDMAAGVIDGKLAIFVVSLAGDRKSSVVTQYLGNGREVRNWLKAGVRLSGIALDSAGETIYVTGGPGSSIYTIALRGEVAPRLLCSVASMDQIGSITVDSPHGRLFVSDISRGDVYAIDLATKSAKQVATSLGDVSALAFDPQLGALYIADSLGRIWKTDPSAPAGKAVRLPVKEPLREPLGLSLGPDGDLLLGDRATGDVLEIKPSGIVSRRFH